ncbi:MAG: 1-acyl-sn-glycerol-3-phosphate acyltransferase [Nitriliruptoraceae bacterium]|nr:1-acyl-sn-glycerol-3-phosphate acyltransferase [Nitriliruptoraceae bacterium]
MTGDAASDGPTGTGPDLPADVAVVPGERSVLRRTLGPTLRAWMRLEADGVEHVPADGPALIASTHRSHGDSMAIAAAIARPVHFLGDVKLTSWPVLGPRLPQLGMIPLRRGEADASALDVIRVLLAEGACIAVYPEGSRSRDGRVHRLRSGVARLAAEQQVPVVPATALGIEDVWPIDGRPRPFGGKVVVRFRPALAPPQDTPKDRRRFNLVLQEQLAELADVGMADTFAPPHGGDAAPQPGFY